MTASAIADAPASARMELFMVFTPSMMNFLM
jgi:hypothetical protein